LAHECPFSRHSRKRIRYFSALAVAIAGPASAGIAFATAVFQSLKAARMDPAKTLKYE
jgi:ABC-type antimicrobial peptide transport system permease subunit